MPIRQNAADGGSALFIVFRTQGTAPHSGCGHSSEMLYDWCMCIASGLLEQALQTRGWLIIERRLECNLRWLTAKFSHGHHMHPDTSKERLAFRDGVWSHARPNVRQQREYVNYMLPFVRTTHSTRYNAEGSIFELRHGTRATLSPVALVRKDMFSSSGRVERQRRNISLTYVRR